MPSNNTLRKTRKNKSKHTRLMDKAWKLCSEYVRRRDDGVCFTCGKKDDWKRQQAGHFIHGKSTPIYFNPKNVNCQCPRCNKWLSGDLAIYERKLQKKYGIDEVDKLLDAKNKIHYYKIKELNEIIADYKQKLELLNEK